MLFIYVPVPSQDEPGFFPAVSLEEGEAVTVNLGQSHFVHAAPTGAKAVIAARSGGAAVAAPPRTAAAAAAAADGGGGGAADEEEEGEGEERGSRTPVDLEEFSCATDLAARFGPNRLKVRVVVLYCLVLSCFVVSTNLPPAVSCKIRNYAKKSPRRSGQVEILLSQGIW